jgi:PhzF family phenazine biosynthesis protein
MKLPLYWIDAFTDRAFHGNPAAVVPLENWPDDAVMQKIAFENGLSETAFFVPTGSPAGLSAGASAKEEVSAKAGAARYHLRWFTPAVEVDLCGHATLASAHVLLRELGLAGDAVTFDTRSGPLVVARRADGKLEMDFPIRTGDAPAEPTPALLRGLGRTPEEVIRAPARWLCVYTRAADVRDLRPDHAVLASVTPGRIMVTAPGDAGDCDFVSRYFAPDAGIAEDPVTGSAHCTLGPYWGARLGKTSLHARQVSARGGELWCTLAGDRVKIAGQAVRYLRGEISL